MKEKRSKKVNGIIGFIRLINCALALAFLITLFIILSSFISMIFYREIKLLFIVGLYLVISLLTFFLMKFNDKYNVRPINDLEIKKLYGKRLIHYSNYINDSAINYYNKTGYIKLIGNDSARSNYRMRYKDKTKKFIWFQIERDLCDGEPDFNSFMQAHYGESRPRKYKVIVDFNDISREKIYINPGNGNVLINGDITVKASLFDEFNWYH